MSLKEKNFKSLLKVKNDPLIIKITNLLMLNGKRSKAEKVIVKTFQVIDQLYPGQAMRIFYLAAVAAKQDIAVRIKPKPKNRRKKQSFDIYLPRLISSRSGFNLGIRSLVKESRDRSRITFVPLWESLSNELLNAAQNKGLVVSNRYKVNKLAVSNKRRGYF